MKVSIGYTPRTKKIMAAQEAALKGGGIFNITKGTLNSDIAFRLRDTLIEEINKRVPDKPKQSGQVGRLRDSSGWSIQDLSKASGENYMNPNNPNFTVSVKPVAHDRTGTVYAEYVNYGHFTRSGGWFNGHHFFEAAQIKMNKTLPAVIDNAVVKDLQNYMEGKSSKASGKRTPFKSVMTDYDKEESDVTNFKVSKY